jgi:hypothetical protein
LGVAATSPASPHDVAQIPKETIEQILAATDIVDLIGSCIPIKRAGARFKANCPFHQEQPRRLRSVPHGTRSNVSAVAKAGRQSDL